MLELADRSIDEIRNFFAARGVEAGYLVPTETGLKKSILDAHTQLREFFRREGLHDYASQGKGPKAKVLVTAWYIEPDELLEATASLYRPESGDGDPRIWITDLPKHSRMGNVLALFVHDGTLYVANVSAPAVWASASSPGTPFAKLLDTISGSKNRPIADKFSAWNLRLLQSFFSEASAGKEVFLRIDKDVLDDIGQDLGGDAGFIDAARTGSSWCRPNRNFVDQIVNLVRQRNLISSLKSGDLRNPRNLITKLELQGYIDPGDIDSNYRGLAAPTYLPYLALFVRIATTYEESGYYQHLRQVLGLQNEITHAQKISIRNAWADLEKWTLSNSERFGRFTLRRLGGYEHIGVPQSQSIFKSTDIQRMPIIFKRAGIRPDRDLDDNAMGRIMSLAKAEAVGTGTIFSRPLCSALGKSEFDAPIASALRAIYDEWDGTLPIRSPMADSRQENAKGRYGLGLVLSVVQEEPLEFDIHWSLPAIHDSGNFWLRNDGSIWHGAYAGADGAVTKPGDGLEDEAWRIAEAAVEDDMQFELISRLGEETEEITEQVLLEKRLLWLLVSDFDGPDGRIWFREGDLPGYGAAFLLAPPENTGRMRDYLEREAPDHTVIDAIGIPDGWMFVRLNECSALKDSQRTLPDGSESHPVPRLVRFVGGRSVRRGYGQLYLPYDLPALELDAPAGAELVCSQGLVAVEQHLVDAAAYPASQFRPVRRFGLRLQNSGSAAYSLEVHVDGKAIGRPVMLRISGGDGDLVEMGRPFSLDSMGRPQSSTEGLSGVLPCEITAEATSDEPMAMRSVDVQSLGVPVEMSGLAFSAEEKFLNALAQPGVGAMDSGTARKLLGRYLADHGRDDNPVFLLMKLRSCGHIEVSTTHKGHMSRVHVVKPTIFELPIHVSGRKVYGVTGSLRLDHWQALIQDGLFWKAYRERVVTERLGALRLVEEEPASIENSCSMGGQLERLGFRYSRLPSLSIVRWSEGMDLVRESALRNPMEYIGRAAEGAMRFNAVVGRFCAQPGRFPHELWKAADLDTGMGSVHYLVDSTEISPRHAFIRDSRWGVWIILDAFARHISRQHNLEDIHPVPLTYDLASGTLWLPARIGLPVVLERALVLCSGMLPSEFELVRGEELEGGPLSLFPKYGGQRKVRVSPFYFEMANGKWLAYPWVPEAVATATAEKLGARLDLA